MNKLAFDKWSASLSLVLMLLMASVTRSNAQQSLEWGIKAGGNLMRISGRSFDGKKYPGFSAGVWGKLNFTSKWSLQPEIVWNQTIAKTSDEFNSIYGGVSQQLVNLNYAAIPIFVSFKPSPWLSILVGPQYSYLVTQTTDLLQNPQDHGKKAFNHNDFSIVWGGQLNFNKVIFGLRYSANLNNISFRPTDLWRQYGFQAYIGYQLGDFKLRKK
ncbi:MAG TPA: porin family protein [Puia sp.]|uniref:porin family protein n=1 Tax=Puia sp. TaxID=2045100 RepID=UPI002BBE8956|nr:porin family protein [Puia sp.]HVU96593.1 porin family protein [Puia sp.]